LFQATKVALPDHRAIHDNRVDLDEPEPGSAVRILFFSDIHGNREAFEACLVDAERWQAERTVLLGDLVGYGADPGWVVDRARDIVTQGGVALLGNHDAAIADSRVSMNAHAAAAIAWTRTQLDEAQRAFLRSLVLSVREEDRLYVHANAWAPAQWGYIHDAREAERSMRKTDATIVFCGHTHEPMLFHMSANRPAATFVPRSERPIPMLNSRKWLAVIGSVGQPRDRNPAACYAIYDTTTREFTLLRVPYDIAAAAAKIRAAGLPDILATRLFIGG
jgi:diadenosine tetraphosphatase ApaH/serine/threonine PP2A family protein phosphatase